MMPVKVIELRNLKVFQVSAELSVLSIVACVLYTIVASGAVGAGLEARAKRQQPWHFRAWILIAIFFALLILSRLFSVEEFLRADLREVLQAQDLSQNRRSIQGPIVAVAIVLFASVAMFAAYWVSQRLSGRRNIAVAAAIAACGVMFATIAMRTISLHALDRLLNGPLKLNWVGDIGSSLVVLGAAFIYVKIVRGRRDNRG